MSEESEWDQKLETYKEKMLYQLKEIEANAKQRNLPIHYFYGSELLKQICFPAKNYNKDPEDIIKEINDALNPMVKVKTLLVTWFWLPSTKDELGIYVLIGMDRSKKKVGREV